MSVSSSSSSSSPCWWSNSLRSASTVYGDPALRIDGSPGPREATHSDDWKLKAGRGRRVVTGNPIAIGSTILVESSFVGSLLPPELDRRCASCWSILDSNSTSGSGQKAAAQRCSGCASTRYCNAACQKKHWNRCHKVECLCLRPYKGRDPHLHPGLKPTLWIVCQLALWRLQRPLSAMRQQSLPPGTTSSPTYLSQSSSRLATESALLDPWEEWFRRFEQNQPNLEQHSEEGRHKYAEMGALGREVTLHICNNEEERRLHTKVLPVEWFVGMFGRLACNGFSVSDDELRPIGLSIFPTVSMLNHSCLPNAIAMFDLVGPPGGASRITIRAIRPIASGEEVNISYIGLTQNTAARRKTLQEQYFFECQCVRCHASDEGMSDETCTIECSKDEVRRNKAMDAFKCQHAWKKHAEHEVALLGEEGSSTSAVSASDLKSRSCPGLLHSNPASPLHPRCGTCGLTHSLMFIGQQLRSSNVLNLLGEVDVIKKELRHNNVSNLSKQRLEVMRIKLLNVIDGIDKAFNTYASHRLMAIEQLIRVAIELQDWSNAYQSLTQSLPIYDFYYSTLPYHPLLGLQYAMHAKVGWLLGDSDAALASWTRADRILRVTHGTTHTIVREIEQSIIEARMEVQQKKQIRQHTQKKITA